MSVEGNGNILVAAEAADWLWSHGVLLQYDPTGTLDASFGDGGRIDAVLSAQRSGLHGLARDADGRVIAVGHAWTTGGAATTLQ